jgi:hypothetical protein
VAAPGTQAARWRTTLSAYAVDELSHPRLTRTCRTL